MYILVARVMQACMVPCWNVIISHDYYCTCFSFCISQNSVNVPRVYCWWFYHPLWTYLLRLIIHISVPNLLRNGVRLHKALWCGYSTYRCLQFWICYRIISIAVNCNDRGDLPLVLMILMVFYLYCILCELYVLNKSFIVIWKIFL